MAWSDAITAASKLASQVWEYFTGGQSRQERTLEDQAADLEKQWHETTDPVELNRIRAELERVRAQAASRKL